MHIKILDTKVSALTTEELLKSLAETIRRRDRAVVGSGNVHAFNLARRLPWFREFLNRADMVRLDGFGIRLGAAILGQRTPPRSTWADFGWALAAMCASQGFRLFFFGGQPGIAETAAQRLTTAFPQLQVAGTQHGFIDVSPDAHDNTELIARINERETDILVVGLGMPKQERWIRTHRDDLQAPVIMTGGAVFEYLAGTTRRAPGWMHHHGLEWLFRLLQNPRRLWHRYLVGNPTFLWHVLWSRWQDAATKGRQHPLNDD